MVLSMQYVVTNRTPGPSLYSRLFEDRARTCGRAAKIGRLHDMRARATGARVWCTLREHFIRASFFRSPPSLHEMEKSCMKRPCKVAKRSSSAAISFLGTALCHFLCKFFWHGCAEFSMGHKRTHKSVCHVPPST